MNKNPRLLVYLVTLLAVLIHASLVHAGSKDPVTEKWATNNLHNKQKAAKIPIWIITQDGTKRAVRWVNADNPRFAVYDPNGDSDPVDPNTLVDDAVLDKETGLVWQRSPDTTVRGWDTAITHCYQLKLADRYGYRLPSIEELASLVYEDEGPDALPAGHPFVNVQTAFYWSSTTPDGVGSVWGVNFNPDPDPFGRVYTNPTTLPFYNWCVRGGQGRDAD